MAETHYSDASEVIEYTGLRPSDLDIEQVIDEETEEVTKTADEALEELITGWLVQVKNLIDQDRNRDYHAEGAVPDGIHNIALRMTANMVAQAIMRRDTSIVRVDDFSVQMVDDQIFTAAIRRDLARFPMKPLLRFARVRREEEMEDAD